MSVLPPSVLLAVPVTFAPGDRVTFTDETHTRDEQGRWMCSHPACPPMTDDQIRSAFTDPALLEVLGAPLIAPASVGVDEPLPGRPVGEGENPFESEHLYLLAGTRGPSANPFVAVPEAAPGPWGLHQRTLTIHVGPVRSSNYEMSQTATGVIWLRLPNGSGTYAYIPATDPASELVDGLLALAVLRAAFPPRIFT
ncbi:MULTISPECIES: hypothetical protein [unclassified Streptomyces]|uniref:hypothetical protein n=1 Tax=unclassified Streptomyces TaxID=2593676 RepID=UPI0035E08C64